MAALRRSDDPSANLGRIRRVVRHRLVSDTRRHSHVDHDRVTDRPRRHADALRHVVARHRDEFAVPVQAARDDAGNLTSVRRRGIGGIERPVE